MDDDVEDPVQGARGKLMQEDGEVVIKNGKSSAAAAAAADAGGKKSWLDFQIDIYIRRHKLNGESTGVTHKYRTNMKRCVLVTLIIVVLLVVAAITLALVLYFLYDGKAQTTVPPVTTYPRDNETDPRGNDTDPTNDVPMRQTGAGAVRGRVVQPPGGLAAVEAYLGIPYAHPPLGPRRYAKPEYLDQLPQDPYIADSYQNSCMQPLDTTYGNFTGSNMWNAPNPLSEDCLFLNVWVPTPRRDGRHVMVWIYGGGFFSGTGALSVYDGRTLAAYGDVIVVSFNYRVGTFGFLSTGDGRITGNFGMWDQVVALQWVRAHIASFGGDPDHVTVFGESSGASSAGYLMMSNHSQHLFERAVFESGSPDSHWAFMTQAQASTRSAAYFKAVGCQGNGPVDVLMTCLRSLTTAQILQHEWVDGNFMVFPWAPGVDGQLLTDTPYNMLKAGSIASKDVLLGVNKDEGTFWLVYALAALSKDSPSPLTQQQYVAAVDALDWDLSAAARGRVRAQYTPIAAAGGATVGELRRDALDEITGDRSFICPTTELADIMAAMGARTYLYYLTHRASNEVWPPWMGVIHGAEIQWVFGMSLDTSRQYTAAEEQFAKIVMSYWVNFAKYGNPNGGSQGGQLPTWPVYTDKAGAAHAYLEFRGAPTDFIVHDTTLRRAECQLWWDLNSKINELGSAK